MFKPRTAVLVILGAALFQLPSCYREKIQFTGDPPESYTSIVRLDTITPQVSTVITDSFVTETPPLSYWASIPIPTWEQ